MCMLFLRNVYVILLLLFCFKNKITDMMFLLKKHRSIPSTTKLILVEDF